MDDLARFCCPNTQCSEFGRRHAGNLSVHDRFGKHRQHRLLCCHVCQHTFSENKGTVIFRCQAPPRDDCGDPPPSPGRMWHPRHRTLGRGPSRHRRPPGPLGRRSAHDVHDESWLFPPATREVQFDGSRLVVKKQKNCDPNNPDDAQCGDNWDFVAFDPEHRLVLAVVPGADGRERSGDRRGGQAATGRHRPSTHDQR